MGKMEKKDIMAYLDKKGFKHAQSGFLFIVKAIEMGLEDRNKISKGITKILYPEVAKEFKTTASRVERAIRHNIETSDFILKLKLKGLGKPTNSEFLARAVDELFYSSDDILYGGGC